MIRLRPSSERGHFDFGWLDTCHTFSFGDYHDPAHMGFRVLRVINEDRVQPGQGFGTHPHRDMEIVTIVLEGALEHRDSLGTGSVIHPGEVQCMSAGKGITHSEFNHSKSEPVHLLQIWILPDRRGHEPRYDQKKFPAGTPDGGLQLVVSGSGRDGSLSIHQDAEIYAGRLADGAEITHRLRPDRHAWVQVARGAPDLDGLRLGAGDGAAVSGQERLRLKAEGACEFLLFDLP